MSPWTSDMLHMGWVTQSNHIIIHQLDIFINLGEIWDKGEPYVTIQVTGKVTWSNSTYFGSQIWAKQTLDWPYTVYLSKKCVLNFKKPAFAFGPESLQSCGFSVFDFHNTSVTGYVVLQVAREGFDSSFIEIIFSLVKRFSNWFVLKIISIKISRYTSVSNIWQVVHSMQKKLKPVGKGPGISSRVLGKNA